MNGRLMRGISGYRYRHRVLHGVKCRAEVVESVEQAYDRA